MAAKQNCKKPLTESNTLHIWPLTAAVLPVSYWLHSPGRQHRTDNRSPGENRGSIVVRSAVDGSLTSLVLMKGHVGDGARSGELKAPDTGYRKPIATSFQAPQSGRDD